MTPPRVSAIEIDSAADSVQHLAPPNKLQRFEGIAFSPCGTKLGVVTADTNTIFLFRRKPDGRFEDAPYASIAGPGSGVGYPHDVSFSSIGNHDVMAVAQRSGSICIYEKDPANDSYGDKPAFEITGATTGLNFSDGVAFVPPHNEYVAVCNALSHKLTFYRRTAGPDIRFTLQPAYELKHRDINTPDGLAFSECGRWLAVANHGNHTVSIHERRPDGQYRPRPRTIIRNGGLRYPHSVAFTPHTDHLVVTNAGANYFDVYAPINGWLGTRWSREPVVRQTVGPEAAFREVNARNNQEGGPKGVAVYKNNIAVCSPEHGVRIYSFHETPAAA